MNLKPEEIVALARKAGVPYGAHAFVLVASWKDGFRDTWGCVLVEGDAARAKAHAEELLADKSRRRPEVNLSLLEIGAPVETPTFPPALSRAFGLIETMRGLIDEAMSTHIYDFDNGDEVDPECGYQAAVDAADAFLAENHLAKPELVRVVVTVEGGIVQDVSTDRPLPGVQVIVLDYDMEGDEDLFLMVDQGAKGKRDWTPSRASVYGEKTDDFAHVHGGDLLTPTKLADMRAPTEKEVAKHTGGE